VRFVAGVVSSERAGVGMGIAVYSAKFNETAMTDNGKSKKILIVDDDRNFRRILRHQLCGMGLAVDEVSNGDDAISCCERDDYDLIIADVNVPVMRGLSFLDCVKRKCPGMPVLVISAFSSRENEEEALLSGANEFLEKPCDMILLRERVNRWLG